MPSIIFDDTLTDLGDSVLGGTRVYYVAWEITVDGPVVHPPNAWDAYTTIGVGHFELGNDLTPAGSISGIGWSEPHWFNSAVGQWIVSPGQVGTDFTQEIAQYIRWAISPGTEIHLYVFGDV